MDFDVSVFIITSDMQYIPAAEYDNRLDGEGMFVMLTNDELNTEFGDDNSICIYKDWHGEVRRMKGCLGKMIRIKNINGRPACPWQAEYEEIPETFKLNEYTDLIGEYDTMEREKCARRYLDGYKTNQEVMRNVVPLLKGKTPEEYIPAIMIAHHIKIRFGEHVSYGYLPAIGQLLFITRNIGMINNSLKSIHKDAEVFDTGELNGCLRGNWWSVTEYSAIYAWRMDFGVPDYYYGYKINDWNLLPLFKTK